MSPTAIADRIADAVARSAQAPHSISNARRASGCSVRAAARISARSASASAWSTRTTATRCSDSCACCRDVIAAATVSSPRTLKSTPKPRSSSVSDRSRRSGSASTTRSSGLASRNLATPTLELPPGTPPMLVTVGPRPADGNGQSVCSSVHADCRPRGRDGRALGAVRAVQVGGRVERRGAGLRSSSRTSCRRSARGTRSGRSLSRPMPVTVEPLHVGAVVRTPSMVLAPLPSASR